MINIEPIVITQVKSALDMLEESVELSSVYINEPSSFPYISLTESDNYIVHIDSGEDEKYSHLMYEINIYTIGDLRKSQARKLAQYVDKVMYKLNFVRISGQEVPNQQNDTVYRYVMRYEAETDGTNIYRR